jgi:hypothetical protein
MRRRVPQASDLVFFHISAVQTGDTSAAAASAEAAGSQEETPAEIQTITEAGTEPAAAEQPGSEQQQPDQAQGLKQQESESQGDKGRKRDLSELLQPGDPVEFVVAASSQDGVRHKGNRPPKLMGKEVSIYILHNLSQCTAWGIFRHSGGPFCQEAGLQVSARVAQIGDSAYAICHTMAQASGHISRIVFTAGEKAACWDSGNVQCV